MKPTHCPFCGNDLTLMRCPECDGGGRVAVYSGDSVSTTSTIVTCFTCKGTGRVPAEKALKDGLEADCERFGEAWKELAKEES